MGSDKVQGGNLLVSTCTPLVYPVRSALRMAPSSAVPSGTQASPDLIAPRLHAASYCPPAHSAAPLRVQYNKPLNYASATPPPDLRTAARRSGRLAQRCIAVGLSHSLRCR